jgi:hypothetical protein
MDESDSDDFKSVGDEVVPSPSGSFRSNRSRKLSGPGQDSWDGMMSPLERVVDMRSMPEPVRLSDHSCRATRSIAVRE